MSLQDWLSIISTTSSFIVAIAAIVAGCLAIKTLRAIEKQTKANMIAAEAARDSAQAFKNKERPWLLVSDVEAGQPAPPAAIQAGFRVKNHGNSPAWIIQVGGTFKTFRKMDLPAVPTYSTLKDFEAMGVALAPGEDISIELNAHENLSGSEDEFYEVCAGNLFWGIYGFVKYRDPFDQIHELRFCYFFKNGKERFRPFPAPSEYVRNT
jgi:hypothetical protein